MEIITGRTGTPHVYAADDAELYKLFLGSGDYLLNTGTKFSASMAGDARHVRINDGSLVMQGRLAKIRTGEFDIVELDAGTTGWRRSDIIVAEYNQRVETRQEEIEGEIVNITDIFDSVELKVVKGTEHKTEYRLPDITTGDIDLGQTHQIALYEVRFDGINNAGLIPMMPEPLDTSPIETAITIATNAATTVRAMMATLQTDVYAYADSLMQGITSGFRGSWKATVTVADSSQAIPVTVSGYSYLASDIFEVYLEGLRLASSEYSITNNNGLEVTLNSGTFKGQMEVVIYRLSEEHNE